MCLYTPGKFQNKSKHPNDIPQSKGIVRSLVFSLYWPRKGLLGSIVDPDPVGIGTFWPGSDQDQ